jgi:pimeloyl-ACP methyl ester carboxylesterase
MISICKGNTSGILFFIHGNSSSLEVYESIVNSSKIAYTKVSIALPGHRTHQHKKFSLKDFSLKAYRSFLIQTINSYHEDIILIGNSLGGHLAIEIAEKIKNLKGLVILGTPPVKNLLTLKKLSFLSLL